MEKLILIILASLTSISLSVTLVTLFDIVRYLVKEKINKRKMINKKK